MILIIEIITHTRLIMQMIYVFLVMIAIIGIITIINTPIADPDNQKRVINISRNNSYNLMKYNCVIMLKEILKHTSKYLNDDVKKWIFKKALCGSSADYWHILSITTNLFCYYLFRTDETIDYKKFRLWFRQNPLYITNDNIDNL